jgi:RHS repeat-associated protein
VIERSRPEVNVTLSMVNFSGATADAGDTYTGLDRFGRVVDQRWTQGTTAASPVVDRYGYTYDRNSNRLTRSNPLATDYSDTYTYDPLNQLQTFTRAGGALSNQVWQFDALGNWTSVTNDGNFVARTTNAQNELTQMGGFVLAYSPTGNLTTDANGRTLAYDAWNRLVSVRDATGTLVARYEYDGLNRRIVEQVGTLAAPSAATAAIRDVFFSQDWQVLEERLRTTPSQVATTADTRFVWSPVYVDAMIARDRNADGNAANGLEERVYALQDANWNTTAIIAAAGVPGVATGGVINRFAYTPYGRRETLTPAWATLPAGSTPAVGWWHAFQGIEFTDVTNLGYARNRDYNASMGRFIQRDPIGFDAGDNNWYRFVGNGPTGKTDPSGLVPWHEQWLPELDYSKHDEFLRERNHWTYSKHSITFTVKSRMSDKEVLDTVFNMLEKFSHFNSREAKVRIAGTSAYFDLLGWGGRGSDWIVGNDDEVGVHLARTGAHELQGTTFGRHQLIGVRKWRVFLDPNVQVCGQKTITIETEADEMPRGGFNYLGSKTPLGRGAQISIWKGHLERTAAAASREFGGKGDIGSASLPHAPLESPCARRNRFSP